MKNVPTQMHFVHQIVKPQNDKKTVELPFKVSLVSAIFERETDENLKLRKFYTDYSLWINKTGDEMTGNLKLRNIEQRFH